MRRFIRSIFQGFRHQFALKKPSLQPPPVLDAIKDPEDLAKTIEGIQDRAMQIAAIKQASDLQTLETLLRHRQRDIRRDTRARLLELLLPDPLYLNQVKEPDHLLLIASATEDPELAQRAIEKLADAADFERLARQHPAAQVRFAAAQNITDLSTLNSLAKHAQGHDKRVYRLCRHRIDEHLAIQREQEEKKRVIAKWFTDLKGCLAENNSPTGAQVSTLEERWAALCGEASQSDRIRAEEQLTALKGLANKAAEEHRRIQCNNTALIQATAEQTEIINALEKGLHEILDIPALELAWQVQSEGWKTAAKKHPAQPHHLAHFERLRKIWTERKEAAERLQEHEEKITQTLASSEHCDQNDIEALYAAREKLSTLERAINWPAEANHPDLLAHMDRAEYTLRSAVECLKEKQPESLSLVNEALKAFRQALEAGEIKTAAQFHQKTLTYLKRVEKKQARAQHRHLLEMGKELRTLQDWQAYAIVPKREALCAQMEALIGVHEPPTVMAEKINELQRQWKTLSARAGSDLWTRFKTAADEAYAPCQAYFSVVAEKRQQNLHARLALCDDLEGYEAALDWQKADWQLVKKTLTAAQSRFRELSPVEHSAHIKSRQRFQRINDKIYAHLRGEHERNIDKKRRLVAQAEALAGQAGETHTELSPLIETAKRLQSEWRAAGIIPQRVEQALWRAFRSALNTLFELRKERSNQNLAEIKATVKEVENLVIQAEESATMGAPQSAQAALGKAQSAIEASELLPRAQIRKLTERLDKANTAFKKRREREANDAEKVHWQTLFSALNACRNKPNDPSLNPPEFNDLSSYPPGLDITLLGARWAKASEPSSISPEIEDILRLQCIALEIALSLPSPESDQELRLVEQMKRLDQKLGGRIDGPAKSLIEYVNRWLASPLHPDWDTRFVNALQTTVRGSDHAGLD